MSTHEASFTKKKTAPSPSKIHARLSRSVLESERAKHDRFPTLSAAEFARLMEEKKAERT